MFFIPENKRLDLRALCVAAAAFVAALCLAGLLLKAVERRGDYLLSDLSRWEVVDRASHGELFDALQPAHPAERPFRLTLAPPPGGGTLAVEHDFQVHGKAPYCFEVFVTRQPAEGSGKELDDVQVIVATPGLQAARFSVADLTRAERVKLEDIPARRNIITLRLAVGRVRSTFSTLPPTTPRVDFQFARIFRCEPSAEKDST